jgi:hypothetical protein
MTGTKTPAPISTVATPVIGYVANLKYANGRETQPYVDVFHVQKLGTSYYCTSDFKQRYIFPNSEEALTAATLLAEKIKDKTKVNCTRSIYATSTP